MQITEDNIEDIKSRLQRLAEFCGLEDEKEEWLELNEEGDDCINLDFPGDNDTSQFDITDFIECTNNLHNFTQEGDYTVRCGCLSQTNIEITYNPESEYDLFSEKYETEFFEAYLVQSPLLIAIRNIKEDCYDSDFWSPCSAYTAIEFKYKSENRILPLKEENKEIQRFLFMLTVKADSPITIQKLIKNNSTYLDEEVLDFENIDDTVNDCKFIISKSEDLPTYNPMLGLYVDAQTLNNEDLKFLMFYKIIEYISPSISKKQAYEMLSKKLDMNILKTRDCRFYDSIIDIVRHFDNSMRDNELAESVLIECCDILSLSDSIPTSIKKQLSKECQIRNDIEWTYKNIPDSQIFHLKKRMSEYLTATRNNIVHAKSNYTPTGKECPESEMEVMNSFMQQLCYAIIMWNNRQSDEMKLK